MRSNDRNGAKYELKSYLEYGFMEINNYDKSDKSKAFTCIAERAGKYISESKLNI